MVISSPYFTDLLAISSINKHLASGVPPEELRALFWGRITRSFGEGNPFEESGDVMPHLKVSHTYTTDADMAVPADSAKSYSEGQHLHDEENNTGTLSFQNK